MVAFGNSVSELIRDFRLSLELARNESGYFVDHLKRYVKRVDGVTSVKKVKPILLLNSTQDKLFLIRVAEKEFLT